MYFSYSSVKTFLNKKKNNHFNHLFDIFRSTNSVSLSLRSASPSHETTNHQQLSSLKSIETKQNQINNTATAATVTKRDSTHETKDFLRYVSCELFMSVILKHVFQTQNERLK